MGWEDVRLADIKEESKDLPAGTYTFQLAPHSANYRTPPWNDKNIQLSLRFNVVEGESKGRAFFHQYDNPEVLSEKAKAFKQADLKKLQVVLGVDPNEGEDTVDYFNRVAAESNPRFTATIDDGMYKVGDKGEMKQGRRRIVPGSYKPA